MNSYVCIHAHFYQPPRENPWLEAIELQDSAYPYHDWNERITEECYAPNAAARILDEDGRITSIVNNYSRISFNFGPTLLSYLAEYRPEILDALRQADEESRELFSGHGSALAQAYNHLILPLASRRDKYTQVCWGIRDFEHHFHRMPEGMWLPETAVDVETLEILAQLGIRFTILAPHQAKRVREIGSSEWRDVSGAKVDPTRAYRHLLPSGRSIDIFFYDGPISQGVAFERLLTRGENFANRLLGAFSDSRTWPQLVHIATDGETYGHHHRYGEMALAFALRYIETSGLARLTIYGEFREKHPPEHEVEIFENTSWSCAHGVERWRHNCGCNSGGRPAWTQAWRRPLRAALDWLRDDLAPSYERVGSEYLKRPWEARNDYVDVINDRSPGSLDRFFANHATRVLNDDEQTRALQLLELQRHAMLMYTSCGWFFDDLAGLETVQVIEYASRVLQLARLAIGKDCEAPFLERLSHARSNVIEHGDGRQIYENHALPARVDFEKVTAHYAIRSLFESYPERTSIYCYDMHLRNYRHAEAGKARLVVGQVEVSSGITRKRDELGFAVVHLGDHNVSAGVRRFGSDAEYDALFAAGKAVLLRGDFPELIRAMDKEFGSATFSLKSLFRDEQKHVLDLILKSTLEDIENELRQVYELRLPLVRFLSDLGIPLPRGLQLAAEFVVNTRLRQELEHSPISLDGIRAVLEEARIENVVLDAAGLEYSFRQTLERLSAELVEHPNDIGAVDRLAGAVSLVELFPFEVDLWEVQNTCYRMLEVHLPDIRQRARRGDTDAQRWVEAFEKLGRSLRVRTTPPVGELR